MGTGSTAAQIVGAVIDDVAELSLFQRTAQWVVSQENPAYTDAEKQEFEALAIHWVLHGRRRNFIVESGSNPVNDNELRTDPVVDARLTVSEVGGR